MACCCGCIPCGCSSYPLAYTLTMSGWTDDTCSDCEVLNDTLTLDHEEAFCQWTKFIGPPSCGSSTEPYSITLICDSGVSTWVLSIRRFDGTCSGGRVVGRYTLAAASWSCLGSNTLSIDSSLLCACLGQPATVTVVPV